MSPTATAGPVPGGCVDRAAESLSLRAQSLRYRYPGTAADALHGVDLAAPGGACLALLGPNGSGKSTLLSLLAGVLLPAAGRIWLEGGISGADRGRDAGRTCKAGPPPDTPDHPGRRVAWLPQIERLSFNLSVADYVLLGRLPHVGLWGQPGVADRASVATALEETGMAALAGRPVNGLSGGELQLARIARCLAQETPVVVLDEPASMLDPAHALDIARALRRLADSGRIVVFSTHDPAFAVHVADHAILLRSGKVIAAGTAAGIIEAGRLEAAFGVRFGVSVAPSPF